MTDEPAPLTEESAVDAAFTRRRWLGLLALAGAGLFAGTQNSEAISGFFSSMAPTTPSGAGFGSGREGLAALGPNLSAYSSYLRNLRLRNITVQEIISAHNKARGTVHNTLPSRAIWGNIRNTLKTLDSLATRLDHPIEEIVSVYRSPAYNARCAGAKSNSYHLRNNAVDVKFDCSPGKVAAMARAMRASGLFSGGVGRYPGFTHIDTRGRNADW